MPTELVAMNGGLIIFDVDVIVCDGFVGNVALKTMEGMLKMVAFYTKKEFTKSLYSRLAVLVASPILRNLIKALDPGRLKLILLTGPKYLKL